MNNTFPKDIMDAMRDAILAILWPKDQIIDFFKNNGCTTNDLKNVYNYKQLNLSRSQIINIVFQSLGERSDGGIGQLRSILRSLIEWSHFDPYYFHKLKKLNEDEAKRRLTHLKQLQEIRDYKIKEKRKLNIKKEIDISKSKASILDLKNMFLSLYQKSDSDGKPLSSQQRGYMLEKFLIELFKLEKLKVTDSIKLNAEQIDGAIKFDGENYIIEAKWHEAFTASDSLYHFSYKVEGKMYGRGLFFSVNGYSKQSIEMLQKGKALKVILFDGGDIVQIIEGLWSFKEMLEMKIKAAQTMGYIYVDINTMREKKGVLV
jgi:hypothetical protein